jgi:glucose-6-phosphate-specific signal transduction histidine kinase
MLLRNIGLTLFLTLAFALGWFSLWVISIYLNNDNQLAVLFLPLGLRLALLILLSKRFWPVLLLVETLAILGLYFEQLQPSLWPLASCLLSIIAAAGVQHYWLRYPLYWQRLILLLTGVTLNSLLHIVVSPFFPQPATLVVLTTFTSGILLVPFIYLIYEYLKQQNLRTFLEQDSFNPTLRSSLFIWGSIFFAIGICIQLTITPNMESLLLVFILLPNVFMAYKFGWQGGVLSTVIGSLLLTITRHAIGTFTEVQELELFLSTQALLGIGLGIAVSRQQQLVQHLGRYRQQLENELKVRLKLAEQLIHTPKKRFVKILPVNCMMKSAKILPLSRFSQC